MHAILGASDACIATHPSDMCVALAALDATVQVTGATASVRFPSSTFIVCRKTPRRRTRTCSLMS